MQAAGVEFNDGVSREDLRIVIESANCTIESFTANEIECRPPILAPAFDARFRYNNASTLSCHQIDSLHVQVSKLFYRLNQRHLAISSAVKPKFQYTDFPVTSATNP